jgi:beta-galactosidase
MPAHRRAGSRCAIWAAVVLGVAGGGLLQGLAHAEGPVDVAFGDDDRVIIPPALYGEWQFKYIASTDLGADARFFEPDFDDSSWRPIDVPSHWELEGFAEPRYGKALAEGTGLYRRRLKPGDELLVKEDDSIFIRFEGALYGLKLWVNGTFIGEWSSGYNPVTFDITDAFKRDADNVFAVALSTRPKGWEFDTNDCWALSGLYREIHLFSRSKIWFADVTTETKVLPSGDARLRVAVKAGGRWKAPLGAKGILLSPLRQSWQEFAFPLQEDGTGETTIDLTKPDLWTAEEPNRYWLKLRMVDADENDASHGKEIGLREVTIDGPVLKLNGRPIKLRGVNHHDIWPEVGRFPSEEQMRRDLELMRAANINFIRTSHYPPHPMLLRLCDEMGFYVMDEVPFGYGDDHLTDPSYEEILRTRARATVLRDKNHPSVIVWSVGNENPITDLGLATGKYVKELDPTRPICFPQVGSYFAKNYERLPEWVDIYAPHYPTVATLRDYATKLKRPTIVTEYAHALGLATDRVEALWDVMAANPVFAGGAVWMFQDQGIMRRSEVRYDWLDETNAVWPDTHHYYDTHNLDGCDGIVYSDRTPQVDYWQVRKVYAPVVVKETTAAVKPGANEVTLHVENRFDFRDLSGVALEWSLNENGHVRNCASRRLAARPHETERIDLPLVLPDGTERSLWTLRARFVDRGGVVLNERTIRLKLGGAPDVGSQLRTDLGQGNLSVRKEDWGTFIDHSRFVIEPKHPSWGPGIREPAEDFGFADLRGPIAGRRLTLAEELRSKSSPVVDHMLFPGSPGQPRIERTGDAVRVWYEFNAWASERTEPEHDWYEALVRPDGSIEVSYDFGLGRLTGTMLEGGFQMAVYRATEFRWIGQGPYAGYPGKERLNEFGIHHLNCEDLFFQGNRRGVDLAVISRPDGTGIAIVGESMDIAVERDQHIPGIINVRHNVLLSGLGNKGVRPEVEIDAATVDRIKGSFTLIPLTGDWPASLVRWFGPQRAPAPVITRPFVKSYDQ